MKRKITSNVAIFLITLSLMYFILFFNNLLFHGIVEVFRVFIAGGIFFFAWNSRKYSKSSYFLFLGIAFSFVGLIDLVHMFAYKGMVVFVGLNANLPTQLWIAARYLESLSLLMAFLFLKQKLNPKYQFIFFGLTVFSVFYLIFYYDIFPDCYIEGVGITNFKEFSEFFISAILLLVIFLFFKYRTQFDKSVYKLLVFSVVLGLIAELAFIYYVSVDDLQNVIGQFFKISSYYFLYKAIVERGLKNPYDLLFREIKQNEEILTKSNANLKKEIEERKDVEGEYRKSEENLMMIMSGIETLIAYINSELQYEFVNKAYTDWYNIEKKDIEGKYIKDILDKGVFERALPHYRTALEGNKVCFENITYKEGHEKHVNVILVPRLREGKVIGAFASITDITDRKQAEKELKEHSFNCTKAQQIAHLGNWEWDILENRISWSDELYRIVGLFPQKFGANYEDYLRCIHPDDLEFFKKTTKRVLKEKGQYLIEYRIVRPNNDIRIVQERGEVTVDINGNPASLFGTVQDITARKQAEGALKDSEYRLATHIELTPMGVVEFDIKNNITSWNPAAEQMFGYLKEEAIGQNLLDILMPESQLKKKRSIHLSYETLPTDYVDDYITKDGRVITCKWFNTPISNANGKRLGTASICQDITDQLKAEKALLESRERLELAVEKRTKELKLAKEDADFANRSKSEFLSNISHELRTPMHQILSFSKFGIDKMYRVEKEKLLHYFLKIRISGNNLLSLLNDLLDLSKIESGRLEYEMSDTDLTQIINSIIVEFDSLLNEKGVILELLTCSSPTQIVCDENRIRQVMRNLLSNAIKFTPKNKKITVSIDRGELLIGQRQSDDKIIPALQVSVNDQGVGIPEDELERVFDKFVQSSKTRSGAGGTGLGLAICMEIVKAHKGKIWAISNQDRGSTFCFILPYDQEILSG
jgi:PAS domain S-box-containing protein